MRRRASWLRIVAEPQVIGGFMAGLAALAGRGQRCGVPETFGLQELGVIA